MRLIVLALTTFLAGVAFGQEPSVLVTFATRATRAGVV